MQSEDQQQQPVVSTTRALTQLMAVPSNRSCADCRSTLVDASQVHASFSPRVEAPVSRYNNFRLNHLSFAPPGTPIAPVVLDPPVDPALFAARHSGGGHGVFVCALCGAAHKLLGPQISVVHAVQDPFAWTPDKVQLLVQAGGNARSWSVYEKYMHKSWKAKRPKSESTIADRLTFIRAKYEALSFVLPPSGPLAPKAWRSIVNLHKDWHGLWEADLHTLSDLELGQSMSSFKVQEARPGEPPNRLVDFFCVVTASDFLDPAERGSDMSVLESPDQVLLAPRVSDCFPAQDSYEDTEFPEHVSTFVCPEGCRPSATKEPPSFFTFVLTCANGDRLYGAVLRLYDEHRDVESLRLAFENSGYTGKLPPWLSKAAAHTKSSMSSTSASTSTSASPQSDVIFLPKCLVVLSHYPFFDLWRKFLLQIYRIILVKAPLPIERFIANFVCEVPLPPPGRIKVKFGFTVKDIWSIQRPPDNQLPLTNFSYRPLFASLSVSNVMVVIGCLLQETRVALVSRHYALLGPVAEALLSLLFPFSWQGMYLPVMPYSLQDILDAPIPYLVGLHSRYLTETPPRRRPHGVVFVDLDRDVVHLGFEDDTSIPRRTPSLPERPALKLTAKLDEFGASVFIRPDTGGYVALTTAEGKPIPYAERDTYAQNNALDIADSPPRHSRPRRKDIFGSVDKAYRDNELLFPISGFLSEMGQLYEREVDSHTDKPEASKFGFLRRNRHGGASFDDDREVYDSLLDITEPVDFSSSEIRNAFLRFFVSLFQNYRQFIDGDSFRSAEFLASTNGTGDNTNFVGHVLKTQMFDRFLEERQQNPNNPVVVFFDESINAKLNRSKKAALTHIGRGGGKKATDFLDDRSGVLTDTFAPPPPSNWGLPDDGRSYHYGSFPELNPELYGKIRPPMQWPQYRLNAPIKTTRRGSLAVQAKEKFVLAKAMAPVVATHDAIYAATKKGVKNLETAISALSSPFSGQRATMSPRGNTSQRTMFRQRRADKSPPRQSVAFSEVTMPSSIDSTFDLSMEMSLGVSAAEELVLNARRKQAILLAIIIKLQAHCRAFLAKGECRRLQEGYKKVRTIPSQDTETDRLKYQRDAAVRIQSFLRTYIARCIVHRRQRAVVLLQGLVHGRRTRLAYRLLLGAIRRLQARARRYIVHLRLSYLFDVRMETYRQQILLLWQPAHTSLCFRSKFWPLIKETGFLRVGLAEAELKRLWKELGINSTLYSPQNGDDYSDRALHIGTSLGIDCKTHANCLKIAALVSSGDFLDTRNSNGNGRGKDMERAASRETAERIQIYEKLSMPNHTQTDLLMEQIALFDVHVKEKKKKVTLSEAVWRTADLADQSTILMLELFPELRDSTNIVFIRPSQKGLRRFRSQDHIPDPLDRAMWAHTLLDERIRRNLKEVASAGLCEIPSLISRLAISGGIKRDMAAIQRQEKGALRAHEGESWERCRLRLMREFFSEARGGTPRSDWKPKESPSSGRRPRFSLPANLHVVDNSPDKSTRVGRMSLPGDNFWVAEKAATRNLPGENFWEATDKENRQ